MSNYPEERAKQTALFKSGSENEYIVQKERIDAAKTFTLGGESIHLMHLANHYYHPVLVSDIERITYLSHIISIPSEQEFLQNIESEAQKESNSFSQFDWWMFSKIDESLDTIYIPYLNSNANRIAEFHPDFIFWLQKGSDYRILFVDPKGTAYTDYEQKADGYAKLFCSGKNPKTFLEHNLRITVHLRFWAKNTSIVGREYQNYWASDIPSLLQFDF